MVKYNITNPIAHARVNKVYAYSFLTENNELDSRFTVTNT